MNQSLYPLFVVALLPLAGCAEPNTKPAAEHTAKTAAEQTAKPAAEQTSKPAAEPSPSGQFVATNQAQLPAAGPNYELATGTVYYSGDPQRGHKPDGTFRRGTKVSLLHRAGVYSVVRSQDGIEAYVATHTLAPLEMQ